MFPETFLFLGERLAVDLLNTVFVREGRVRDLLGSREDVTTWAQAAGVGRRSRTAPGSSALAGEPESLRALREALRRGLVAWAATGRAGPRLVTLLNRYLARDPELLEVGVHGGKVYTRRRQGTEPLDRLYGAVARSAAELLASGDPRRLRKCANPVCRLMFYDVSKAGRRRWCSMQLCGARAKARTYYRRRRAARRT